MIDADRLTLAQVLSGALDDVEPMASPVLARSVPEVVRLVGAQLEPLPWDSHEYTWSPPPPLPTGDRLMWALIKGIKAMMEEALRDRDPQKRLPPPDKANMRQLEVWARAAVASRRRGDDARALGVLTSSSELQEEIRAWIPDTQAEYHALMTGGAQNDLFKSRLVFERPLMMLHRWLREQCSIRHFSGAELTRHKWRFPWSKLVIPGVNRSAWSYVYAELRMDYLGVIAGVPLAEYVIPQPEMWPRILPVIIHMDRYREWLGDPVTCISGYRCASYNLKPPSASGVQNAGPGGAVDSRHMSFEAMDFVHPDRSPHNRSHIDPKPFQDFYEMYRDGRDGIGYYDTFLHFDRGTRGPGSGKSSRWSQRTHPADASIRWSRGTRPTSKR